MKKIFLIVLVVLILLLAAGWIYLLLNGAPDDVADIRSNIFGNSGPIEKTQQQSEDIYTEVSTDIAVEQLLVKLTTRNTAGAVIFSRENETVVRYIEKGTGHIYDISLSSGNEVRVSQQTVPRVVSATWSPTGNRAVLLTDNEGSIDQILLTTIQKSDSGGTILEFSELPSNAENITFADTGDALYFSTTDFGQPTQGNKYSIKTGGVENTLELPFSESFIMWDVAGGVDYLVYTKPTSQDIGYAYKTANGTLEKINEGFGLTIEDVGDKIQLTTKVVDGKPLSFVTDPNTFISSISDVTMFPEKCGAGSDTEVVWCGADTASFINAYPDDWYQGVVSFADQIWQVDIETGEGVLVADPFSISGEYIDVTDLSVSNSGQHVIFTNKRDGSLWLFNPPGFDVTENTEEVFDPSATSTDTL